MWLRKEAFGPKSPPFQAVLPKATAWMNLCKISMKRSKGAFPCSPDERSDIRERA